VVFLSEYIGMPRFSLIAFSLTSPLEYEGRELETLEVNECAPFLKFVEADCYWSFSRLLDGLHVRCLFNRVFLVDEKLNAFVQDNYTPSQPGIQFSMWKLKDIISRVDSTFIHLFSLASILWVNALLTKNCLESILKNTKWVLASCKTNLFLFVSDTVYRTRLTLNLLNQHIPMDELPVD